jgi:UDP-glucose 4-epimerase
MYRQQGWRMFSGIDRVYVNERARKELGWQPRHDFDSIIDCLKRGIPLGSSLSRLVGSKGYHDDVFAHGPYPVE